MMSEWWWIIGLVGVIVPLIGILIAVIGIFFRVGRWVGDVNTDRKNFRDFMTEVRKDITEVREDIKKILRRSPPAPVEEGSPLTLSDLGKEISETLHTHEWAEDVATTFSERVKGKEPYQVHEMCFDYIKNEFTPTADQDRGIGTCAYEKSIDRDKVLDVFAVELRDVLLEKYL